MNFCSPENFTSLAKLWYTSKADLNFRILCLSLLSEGLKLPALASPFDAMADLCYTCNEPLVVEIDPDSDVDDGKSPTSPESVPDDVELKCGCHFHW